MNEDQAVLAITYAHEERGVSIPISLVLEILKIEQKHLFDTEATWITKKIDDTIEKYLGEESAP